MSKSKPPDFVDRLKAWRAKFGYSQADAAVELKVSKRTLQNWEVRYRAPMLNSVEHVLVRLQKDGF